ncbi:MAG: type II toxin-antitoxin system PemK/MazF family toxin [Sphingobacteriaceae bacterium]|nr:type II toxin-antitoxin system PemK/MazF family toxin [Cytophagaceae bacterium]
MSHSFGEIVLLRFPFTDGRGFKQRPAVVLKDAQDGDLLVARVTSRLRSEPYEVLIQDWQAAGLLQPSQIRIHKIASLEISLVVRNLGTLSASDLAELRRVTEEFWTSL